MTFLKDESVMACLGSTPHVIDGKTVDPKPATMKNADSQQVWDGTSMPGLIS